MSALQGLVFYPGLSTFTCVEYTLSQGISPNTCFIEMPQETVNSLEPSGDLTFRYGQRQITLYDCLLDKANVDMSEGGFIARVQIQDRRWRWKYGYVSGHYNIRMPNGSTADEGFNSTTNGTLDDASRILQGTEKNPQELATFCLQAMGENRFDVSALPNEARPGVHWSYTNPAEALQSLCEELGCRVVLCLEDDSTHLVKIGVGEDLPESPTVIYPSVGANPPELPSRLLIKGGPTIYQGMLPLIAVGEDLDGSVKPINDLSYKPKNGWKNESPSDFPSITDPLQKTLAEKCIYRMWQVDINSVEIPGPNPPALKSINQLRLYHRLIDSHWDSNDPARIAGKRPEIWGSFDESYRQEPQTATGSAPGTTPGAYKDPFYLDSDRAIIVTSDCLISIDLGVVTPASIALKGAYSIRDADTLEPLRYTRTRDLNPQSPTMPRVVHREEIFLKIVGDFDMESLDSYSGEFSTNLDSDSLDQEADYWLDAAQAEYIEEDSLVVPYADLLPIQVDGLISQVTWMIKAGEDGYTKTIASLAAEHNPYVLPWSARRRVEKAQADDAARRAAHQYRRLGPSRWEALGGEHV